MWSLWMGQRRRRRWWCWSRTRMAKYRGSIVLNGAMWPLCVALFSFEIPVPTSWVRYGCKSWRIFSRKRLLLKRRRDEVKSSDLSRCRTDCFKLTAVQRYRFFMRLLIADGTFATDEVRVERRASNALVQLISLTSKTAGLSDPLQSLSRRLEVVCCVKSK